MLFSKEYSYLKPTTPSKWLHHKLQEPPWFGTIDCPEQEQNLFRDQERRWSDLKFGGRAISDV